LATRTIDRDRNICVVEFRLEKRHRVTSHRDYYAASVLARLASRAF